MKTHFMKTHFRILAAVFAMSCLAGGPTIHAQKDKGPKADKPGNAAKAARKMNHHNGRQLLGEKLKTNGNHVLDKKGNYTALVNVKGGKVAGLNVKHIQKGDVPVTKYKTRMKVVQADGPRFVYASLPSPQYEYLGTEYIGYAYIDEYGYEEIYWFPYDVIYDGDTGAIEWVPAYY